MEDCMSLFLTILKIETLKVFRSKILIGTFGFFIFIALITGLFTYFVKHPELMGDSAILNAKASMIAAADCPSYIGLMIQLVLTAGTFGFGIPAGWIFGREFVDHVVKDLLAIPVSRFHIVLGKFVVMGIWNITLAVVLYAISVLMGLWIGLDNWSSTFVLRESVKFLGSAGLTIALCPVISFFASVSRGYLLPLGIIIVTMMITQMAFIGLTSIAPFLPWAIPGLYSGVAGPTAPVAGIVSYLILMMTCLGGIAATAVWWRYADQA